MENVKTCKKTIHLSLILFLIAGLVGCAINQPTTKKPIKMGFVGSLSGDLAWLGEQDKNATLLAVEKINQQGGINSQMLKIIYEDGKCSGSQAVSVAKKLINIDQVKIILGGTCSTETLVMAPITQENRILLFTSWALNPTITSMGDLIFRNAPSDTQAASATVNLAFKNGVTKMGLITEKVDYTEGFRNIFLEEFKKLDGNVVADELIAPGIFDFKTSLAKILKSKPDAILINAQGNQVGLIGKQLDELKYDGQLYGNVYFSTHGSIKDYAQYIEGGYSSQVADLDKSNPKINEFISDYRNKFGKEPADLFWTAARYDSVYILAQAIQQVGLDIEEIKKYLYNITDFDGLLGNYHFNDQGDIVGIKFQNRQIIDGEIVNISD